MGYALGAVDPLVHLKPELLSLDRPADYPFWADKLSRQIRDSREEFIVHHRENRGSVVPVWVAVDVLDWGGLSYLFSFAPSAVREEVAQAFGFSAAQLKSWLRALNVVRNVCAHHSRFCNRYYSLTPKLPRRGAYESLDGIGVAKDSTFGMRTLPMHSGMDISATGGIVGWDALSLWK